jgi:glutamine synthetase
MTPNQAEYIWQDGATPTQQLRSKSRIITFPENRSVRIDDFPICSFDGSSTYQAKSSNSDLILKPVNFVTDPLRGAGNFLVLCEVFNADGTPHETNTRARLRQILDSGVNQEEPWVGFEQEYALLKGKIPLGFPKDGYPAPQGPYYCSVGAATAFGRPAIEAHTKACLKAGLMIYGINAEVLPGQWEFQIGYRGIPGESPDPLTVSDHLWLARWLLFRIGEDFGVSPTLAPKPVKGDWNGSGMHTNFSTKAMRDPKSGMGAIEHAIKTLRLKHSEHIWEYGDGVEERLTGEHETCAIDQFHHGIGDRGASIRIPTHVATQGYGYLEDRRPAANADPYVVSARILETICVNGRQKGYANNFAK